MKKTFVLAAAVIVAAQIGGAVASDPVNTQGPLFDRREQPRSHLPISSASSLFAIIDAYDSSSQSLQIRMVSSVMSPDGSTILFPGDKVLAVVDPLKPGNTRQAVCVTAIQGREGAGRVIPHRPAFPREGCLAQLHDYEGSAGLPATDIRVGLPVRVMLNGDLLLEGKKG